VVYCDEGNSFVLADIPGLIEGASDGLGLGHTFLRHVERTRLIVHVIDMSGSEGRDPFEDFLTINNELSLYSPALAKRPQIIAANKMDENGAVENLVIFKEKLNAWLEANEEEVADAVELGAWKIFEICAAIAEGTSQLMAYTGSIVHKMPLNPAFDEADEYVLYDAAEEGEDGPLFTVTVDEDGVYVIEGTWIEQVFNSVNLADNESSQYFQRLLRTKGVIDELERLGIQEEDTVRIADTEFDFVF
jgi:GTP-binding protein